MATNLAEVAAVTKKTYPRTRTRRDSFKIDRAHIADRIERLYKEFSMGRDEDIQRRVQRYAKYRQWTSGEGLWDDSSDAALPDMQSGSLRVKDTLHNSVISSRPIIYAKAVSPAHKEKEEAVSNLLDHQIFVDQNGEEFIGELAEAFVDDGIATVFVPWIREKRQTQEVKVFSPIPTELEPLDFFMQILTQVYPQMSFDVKEGGWDWEIHDPSGEQDTIKVSFYTRDDLRVEMLIYENRVVFDGPRPMVKDYEDVLYPRRCANLQIPSPSNPNGATQVILVDYPTVDEIVRLKKQGSYDLITEEDEKKLRGTTQLRDPGVEAPKKAMDDFQGETGGETRDYSDDELNKTVTRFLVFDIYDINGDGIGEDVMWWFILEEKMVVKAKLLVEMYPPTPGQRPRRPLAGRSFIPVKNRYVGMSLLEQMEGIHDLMKMLIDFTMNAGIMSTSPFFFYRAIGSVKPEIIRLAPGEGYPVGNPQQDVFFPQIQNQAATFGINLFTLFDQIQQKQTMLGDLQFGRVPVGRASALRTTAGINSVMSQGEARPERILRRFFMLLTEVYSITHMLNASFLPKKKQYRIHGYQGTEKDAYRQVDNPESIAGVFDFDFQANVFNTNKIMLQQTLGEMMAMFVSPLNLQLGVIDPEGIFRLEVDWAKAKGHDAMKYLKPPTPSAMEPKIMAEEALSMILETQFPIGIPEEGLEPHIQKLLEFTKDEEKFGLLNSAQVGIFGAYLKRLQMALMENRRQMAMMQAAGQFGQGAGMQAQGGGAEAPVDRGGPAISGPGELLDESLPEGGAPE